MNLDANAPPARVASSSSQVYRIESGSSVLLSIVATLGEIKAGNSRMLEGATLKLWEDGRWKFSAQTASNGWGPFESPPSWRAAFSFKDRDDRAVLKNDDPKSEPLGWTVYGPQMTIPGLVFPWEREGSFPPDRFPIIWESVIAHTPEGSDKASGVVWITSWA